jgi:hypothetical protein
MKVNILPSILKGGGGRDKGGTEKEGGRTGRGDIQGGRTYKEGGHTGRGDIQGGGTYREGGHTGREDIQGGGAYREGGHTWRGDREGGHTGREGGHTGSGGWVVSVRGGSLSVGVRYSRAGSSCVRGRSLFVGGVVVVRGGSSLSAVGGHRRPWARRCLSYVGGGSLVLYGGFSRLFVRGGVVVVYGGSLWMRGGSLWSMVSVGGRRPWVGGRRCACVGSLSVHACVGGRPRSWAPDRCSGAVIEGGGRSWCVVCV